jgi:hypothetical protein
MFFSQPCGRLVRHRDHLSHFSLSEKCKVDSTPGDMEFACHGPLRWELWQRLGGGGGIRFSRPLEVA